MNVCLFCVVWTIFYKGSSFDKIRSSIRPTEMVFGIKLEVKLARHISIQSIYAACGLYLSLPPRFPLLSLLAHPLYLCFLRSVSLSVSLSFCLSVSLCLSLFVYIPLSLSLSLSLSLCVCLSLYTSIHFSCRYFWNVW